MAKERCRGISRGCWIIIIALVVGAVLIGCGCGDPPRFCPPGMYSEFVLWREPSYKPALDSSTIWMRAKPFEGESCLPRDLSIQNLSTPSGVKVDVWPSWIKGGAKMPIYIYGVSKIPREKPIVFEIWQGMEKKQTIRIGFTKPPDVHVVINGQSVRALVPEDSPGS